MDPVTEKLADSMIKITERLAKWCESLSERIVQLGFGIIGLGILNLLLLSELHVLRYRVDVLSKSLEQRETMSSALLEIIRTTKGVSDASLQYSQQVYCYVFPSNDACIDSEYDK